MNRMYRGGHAARAMLLASTCLGVAAPAAAQFTTPQVTNAAGAESTTFQGEVFVNQGLVGAGRFAASSRDSVGDTLGSFSAFVVDQAAWRRRPDGTYSGALLTLPDRGYNSDTLKTDFVGRVQRFDFTFNPYTGTATLPASLASQSQLELTYRGTTVLKDFTGQTFTGLDPAAGTGTQGGFGPLPVPQAGAGAGRIALDAEGLTYLPDGSFYVSDEYAAGIYYFDKSGVLKGVITPPPALMPRTAAGAVNYNSDGAPATGRRNNQGLEGLTVTPDGKHLVALLQSATVQDTNGSAQQTRSNTRLMVYDITGTRTPTDPVAHYVLQLPTYTLAGDGSATNRTAAQSEILALNDKQFLVLSRDGNGLGTGTTNPHVFKNILLVDISGATNIVGTPFEQGTTPISPTGVLSPQITPVQQSQFVNMLNPTQLGRIGMNTGTNPANRLTLSEKWEALGLAPVLKENAPQDYFLFVGNDNDFLTRTGQMAGGLFEANGQPVGTAYDAGLENDSVVLVYQLTLPTYVNPLYYQAMSLQAPALQSAFADATKQQARATERNVLSQLGQSRQARRRADDVALAPQAGRFGPWIIGDYTMLQRDQTIAGNTVEQTYRGTSVTVGGDVALGAGLKAGVAASYISGRSKAGYGTDFDSDGVGLSVYGSYEVGGFFVDVAYAYTFQNFDKVRRPDPYDLAGHGSFDGYSHTLGGQVGYNFVAGRLVTGPVAGLSYVRGDFDGFTETGAAGGNIRYPGGSFDSLVGKLAWQVSYELRDRNLRIVPFGEISYEREFLNKGDDASFSLASTTSSLGTITVGLPSQNQHAIGFNLGAQAVIDDMVTVGASYGLKSGDDGYTRHSVMGRVSVNF